MAIEYNEDEVIMGTARGAKNKRMKGFIGFMMKKGWIKNKIEGTIIMLIILIILVIITLVLRNRLLTEEERRPAIESIPPSVQEQLPENVKNNLR